MRHLLRHAYVSGRHFEKGTTTFLHGWGEILPKNLGNILSSMQNRFIQVLHSKLIICNY